MKNIKQVVVLITVFLMLPTITFATDMRNNTFKDNKIDENIIIEQTEIINNINNFNLPVKVVRVTELGETVLYEGMLGGYDNGIWTSIDFSDIDFLGIFDWDSTVYGAIYIIPISNINTENESSIETELRNDEIIKDDFKESNEINGENIEQNSQMAYIQLVEYDVFYDIISGDSLSMNIDYNIYNGEPQNKTVSIIAALYENGRLSDIQTQNINVDSEQNNIENIILSIPNSHENYSVKLMAWEGMDNLKPIGNVKHISDLDGYSREKYMYITSASNVEFNVYMNAETVKGSNFDALHTLKYNPAKFSSEDLCGFTYDKEYSEGEILNTNITIQNVDLSEGKIEYKFNLEEGRNTGVTNLVKFKTLSEVTNETIIYTIQ